jgi:aryl-alcohol dehydrogenase-like predicted oxidoreductase
MRKIGEHQVPAMGFGCMNISHAYGAAPAEEYSIKLLHRAFDIGVRHFDTAALYGFGKNETLVGKAIQSFRSEIHLASKCGMTGVDGKRVIDGRPETLLKTLDEGLERLGVDHIDLYYLHRWDKQVPIEDSVGALGQALQAGKIGAIGLSEVSAATLRKAHAEQAIAAVQTEYSLWSRNAEIAVIEACKEIGAAFVAFSPLARGFLAGSVQSFDDLEAGDIRRNMPRFQEPNLSENLKLYAEFKALAEQAACTPGQLALAWGLSQGDHIVSIPGTRSIERMEENWNAGNLTIDASILQAASELINQSTVTGPRYPENNLAEIDTEDF